MANVLVEEQTLKNIADSIRAKSGKTEKMLPSAMSNEIDNLPSGGTGGSDTRLKEFIEGTLTELYDDSATSVGYQALNYNTTLTSINLPKVNVIETEAFSNCYNISEIHLPSVTEIGGSSFEKCNKLTHVVLENVTTVHASAFENCQELVSVSMPKITDMEWANVFYGCSKLQEVRIPNVQRLDTNLFYNCTSLSLIDCSATFIRASEFRTCSNLETIILRNESGVCTLDGDLSFLAVTKIFQGQGFIYVPKVLEQRYKYAYEQAMPGASNLIRAIEDYPEICNPTE